MDQYSREFIAETGAASCLLLILAAIIYWQIREIDRVLSEAAANLVLLYLSMALCVFPTVAHIGMLVVDVFRYILKRVCEGLMDVFDRLASGPVPVRRFLLGALSILSALGWLLG